jgi:hypothetical protein
MHMHEQMGWYCIFDRMDFIPAKFKLTANDIQLTNIREILYFVINPQLAMCPDLLCLMSYHFTC